MRPTNKKELGLAKSAKGGQGASRIEDLLEKLSDYKKSQYGNKYKAGGKFEQGGQMKMPLPEMVRSDKMFAGARYSGKMKNTLARNADNAYVSGDLRFYSFDDDGFYVVDKDNNTWSVDKWYRTEGDEDQEFALDDYVMKNLDAKRSSVEETVMASEAQGGQGASKTEDLLEKLSDYKRNQYGNKYKEGGKFPDLTGDGKVTMADILKGRGVKSGKFEQGGEVKGDGYSIKIAGQYAVGSIKTIPDSGQQYVSMELPDGKVVPVFGDWESYGNPNREGLIEDMDYRIFPLGDGTYSLDTGEMESEMMRDDSRKVAREAQGGQGASRMEDLMEKLSDYKGMGQSPSGRMRPYKRQ